MKIGTTAKDDKAKPQMGGSSGALHTLSPNSMVDAALLQLAMVLAEIARGGTIQEQTEAQDAEEATL